VNDHLLKPADDPRMSVMTGGNPRRIVEKYVPAEWYSAYTGKLDQVTK
jgi:hypothetical protein